MDIIGKRVRVQIGGEPPKPDEGVIVGDDTLLHVSDSDIGKYQHVTGERVEVVVGNPDSIIQQIQSIMQNESHPKKEEILDYCKSILCEQDVVKKRGFVQTLISNAGSIASIASLAIQLSGLKF